MHVLLPIRLGRSLAALSREEDAVALTEYAIILALLAVGCLLALGFLSGSLQDVFEMATDHLEGAVSGQDPVEIARAKGRRWHNKIFGP